MHKKTLLVTVLIPSVVLFSMLLMSGHPVISKSSGDPDTVNWVQLHPVNSPPERSEAVMAYDRTRGYTVVFGGYGDARYMNDTWEWDGADWVQRLPETMPSKRTDGAMVYDVGCGCMVLFGGSASGTPENDTWQWNGSNWMHLSPATSPTARNGHAMAYDSGRRRIVLFGGWDGQNSLSDTWEWDGLNWTQLFPASAPSGRNDHAMAYDSKRERVMLFGGAVLSDTWEWDGVNWTQKFPLQAPSARSAHDMVYDSARGRIVLFGEWNNGSHLNDTWEWDGTNWIQRFPTISPPVRFRNSMAYDSMRKRVVLFGGSSGDGERLGDTWEYLVPELSVGKQAHTDWVLPGEQLTYTLMVTNTGNVTLTATITDVLPVNVTLDESSGGSIILPHEWLVWSPVTIAPAEVWTKNIIVTVTLESAGPFTNTVHVTTQEEAQGEDSVVVTAEESVAGLMALNDSPTRLGDLTTLTATIAAGSNVAYFWDFGDGETGNGAFVSHTYESEGIYTAVVTASNSLNVLTATSTITITPAPITMLIVTNNSPTPLGRPTTLTATAATGSSVTYTWDFGDGKLGYGAVVLHSYPACGIYTAIVTASNSANYLIGSTSVKIATYVYLPIVLKRWPPVPYSPTLYSISNPDSGGNYILDWTEQPTRLADTYILEEATDTSFTVGLRTVCTTAQQSCSVNSKTAGTYYYRVRGQNQWGYGEWSNVQAANVLLPDVPVIAAIGNADGDGNYTVQWNATARAMSYTLQEDTTPSFDNPVAVYSGAQTSWAAIGKTAGTYYYRVLASGATGQSAWSAAQSVIVGPPDAPYLNPIDNADGDGYYAVTWGAAARATGYVLEEATNTAFNNAKVLYSGAELSWSVVNQPYGTYYYRVHAVGPTGQSGWSNIQSTHIPSPPSGVSILNTHTTYKVSSYRYVVGEVYNNTSAYLQFVKVAVNFFNGGQLVGTDYSYIHLDNLHPYEKTCFSIILDNPSAWTHYTFESPTYWNDGTARPNLTITTHSGGVYQTSYYRVIGQIRNDEPSEVTFVSAVATLYNSTGKVVDCDYSYVNSTDLNPGATSSFEILSMAPNPSSVTSYVLQTDGNK